MSAGSMLGHSGDMIPQRKKLWRDESAAEVMGPVESGERMMAKNGDRSVVNGKVVMSRASRAGRV